MFDFPAHVRKLEDIPENFQNLYVQDDEGCTLLDVLAQKMTSETDQNILNTLKTENENLQGELGSYREIAETPASLSQKISGINTSLENLTAKLSVKENQVSDLHKLNDGYMIAAAATEAITAAKGNVALLLPHVQGALMVAETSGVRVVQATDGQEDGETLSVADLVARFKNMPDFSRAFDNTHITGGGMSPVGHMTGARQVNSLDQNAINSKIEEIAAGKITVSL